MTQVAGALAAAVGYTIRAVVGLLRVLPGTAGPAGIVIGIWLYDYRAALIVAGVILVLADLRIPAGRHK